MQNGQVDLAKGRSQGTLRGLNAFPLLIWYGQEYQRTDYSFYMPTILYILSLFWLVTKAEKWEGVRI